MLAQSGNYDASYTPLDAHYEDDCERKYIRKLRDLVFPNIGWAFTFLAVAACANLAVGLATAAHFTGVASLPVVLPALALGGSAALICDAVLVYLIGWLICNELWYLKVPHAVGSGISNALTSIWFAIGMPFISIALFIWIIIEAIVDNSTVWYVLIGLVGPCAITSVFAGVTSIAFQSMIKAAAAREALAETRF